MTAKENERGVRTALARPWMDSEALRRRIAKKAHALFESRGFRHGRDREDWLEAERLIHLELEAEVEVLPAVDVTRRAGATPVTSKGAPPIRRPGEKPGRGVTAKR